MTLSGETTESQVNAQFARVNALAVRVREEEALETLRRLLSDGPRGIGRIPQVVTNLKDFSRLDREKPTTCDLREGLESTLRIAGSLVTTSKMVRGYGDIAPVSCVPSQINQVFLSLLVNAMQAIAEDGGTIKLVTRRVDDAHVAVDVEDDGHGIPAEVLPRMFDPFFSNKDVGRSAGLSLSIACKIVQQHGGRIDVKSEPGAGARFTATLPVEQAPVPRGPAEHAAVRGQPAG